MSAGRRAFLLSRPDPRPGSSPLVEHPLSLLYNYTPPRRAHRPSLPPSPFASSPRPSPLSLSRRSPLVLLVAPDLSLYLPATLLLVLRARLWSLVPCIALLVVPLFVCASSASKTRCGLSIEQSAAPPRVRELPARAHERRAEDFSSRESGRAREGPSEPRPSRAPSPCLRFPSRSRVARQMKETGHQGPGMLQPHLLHRAPGKRGRERARASPSFLARPAREEGRRGGTTRRDEGGKGS